MKRDGFVWAVGIQINRLCKLSLLSDKYTGDAKFSFEEENPAKEERRSEQ